MSSSPPEDRPNGVQSKPKPFSISLSSSSANGTKKSSFPLQLSSRSSNLPGGGLPRRSRHLQDHDASDEEEAAPAPEEVTGFDTSAGGAISKDGSGSKEKAPLVIKVESRNNWRDRPGVNRRGGGKNLLPQEVQAQRDGQAGQPFVETERPNMSSGLSYAQPRPAGTEEPNGGDVHMADANTTLEPKKLTQDEIAFQALIRDSKEDGQGRRSDLVIESSKQAADGDAGDYKARYDESSSFRADVATRPDAASLEDYDAIPVEEFGAALLRGMGWKDGQSIGRSHYGDSTAATQSRIPERRPGYLGIGAKDIGNGKGAEVEIGAWGKAAMRKGTRKNNGSADGGSGGTEGVYMPVVMKSKTTGEYITEDELKLRQKEAKDRTADDEWRERRDRNLGKSGRERRRDDNEEDDGDRRDGRLNISSRRNRSRSSDRRSRRYERDDDVGSARDSRHYRERDRDRKYRDSPRSRGDERYSSSRHSSSTPSRRDRDVDRDRDRNRDGDRRDRNRDRERDRDGHRRRDDR